MEMDPSASNIRPPKTRRYIHRPAPAKPLPASAVSLSPLRLAAQNSSLNLSLRRHFESIWLKLHKRARQHPRPRAPQRLQLSSTKASPRTPGMPLSNISRGMRANTRSCSALERWRTLNIGLRTQLRCRKEIRVRFLDSGAVLKPNPVQVRTKTDGIISGRSA